ncbi:hypothetical protein THAOC_11745 [Thalassiosira oceanica]|uniref:Uncharacterized protein n=1 Tax=Thalassiosira oceanica TaxID=159749 RepID=K0T1Y6_THAOC|nr:hypothetical protein THAOC_11745 [Thalassiosira oceanica]|eukprot:EJK67251.1 hypothetical protein THAOC_11745 [Thalassiosira oceanica]
MREQQTDKRLGTAIFSLGVFSLGVFSLGVAGWPDARGPRGSQLPTPAKRQIFDIYGCAFFDPAKPDQDQEQAEREGREKRGGERREGGEGKRGKEWCYLIHGAHSRTGVVVSSSFSRRCKRLKRGSQALVMQSSLLLPSVHEAVEFTHCTAKPIDPHLARVFFSEPRPSST